MNSKKRVLSVIASTIVMLLLMLDAKTASAGAAAGIHLCIKVIIPSLFPFFIVTTYMNAALLGLHVPGIRRLGKILRIPNCGESLLLIGLIGGYPVGAQIIGDAYRGGQISKRTGKIMLGYCSNAGPAFIFGVSGTLFASPRIPFLLWLIHLTSAIITGLLLPRPEQKNSGIESALSMSLVQAVQKSITICLTVCGWVITFKTIMAYIEKWVLAEAQGILTILATGILELSNGCVSLAQLPSEVSRFLLCSVFLAFGGICVVLQTASVTEKLGLGLYIHGKIIQSCISLSASVMLIHIVFTGNPLNLRTEMTIILICAAIVIVTKILAKKVVEIPKEIMYNSL